jgi:short subunit dehydrogenase-like uncharacterized protein
MTGARIYGANGYTGELTTRFAAQRKQQAIVAGRSAERVRGGRRYNALPPRPLESPMTPCKALLKTIGVAARAQGASQRRRR